MPDIFDEVEEDLRADRARRLLLRYGGLLVALVVAVIAGVGAYQYWVWHRTRSTAETAEHFLSAVQAAEAPAGPVRDAAVAKLDAVIASSGSGYRTLALLRKAAVLEAAGNIAGASLLWDQVSGDRAADPILRDVGSLQWALHNLDNADPAAVRERLQPLTAPGNAWHGLADEAQALLDIRQGRIDSARDTLRLLAQDTGAPDGVRRRAGGLLEQLGRNPDSKTAKAGNS